MEISKDALLRVVSAARMAQNMAENMRKLFVGCDFAGNGRNAWTMADEVAGQLADALNMINREEIDIDGQFGDSRTYRWLFRSGMTDAEVADEFARMAEENAVRQPRPNLMGRDEFNRMVDKSGCGYRMSRMETGNGLSGWSGKSTPEGEWK